MINHGSALHIPAPEFTTNTIIIHPEAKPASVRSGGTPFNDGTRLSRAGIDPGRHGNRTATQDPFMPGNLHVIAQYTREADGLATLPGSKIEKPIAVPG